MTLDVREAGERARKHQTCPSDATCRLVPGDDYLALLDLARRLAKNEHGPFQIVWTGSRHVYECDPRCHRCKALAEAREAGLLEEKP